MAGYGNRTAPDYTAESLTEEHSNTRLGLTDSHSPPTYGAGFGNKTAPQPSIDTISPSTSHEKSVDEEDTALRFNSQDRHGSAPYSNAHHYGSASTAGAGYGNKTGSFGDEEHKDSTLGKVMEKVGGIVHSPGLVKKGQAKRAEGPSGADPDAPVAN
ncbi:hypothetical protein N0V91_007567 [Didymella pomorum]|uniref:Uncharacterized protein n=1 Tax=Didymella pomorum TaxID=749634 RepID=A0A9W8ZAJ5_9PLEO|nr:hypothetical protein N0V91_007567 [Didymella pomorum]